MEKFSSRFAFGLALSLGAMLPTSALAYLSPQEVFNPGQATTDQSQTMVETARFDNFVQAPPTLREGEEVVKTQQERAAANRAAAQSELQSIDAEPVDTYIAADAPKKESLLDNDVNYQVRQQRIAEQKASGPTIVIAGEGVRVDSNGKVLHSGAPRITRTGPETVLAFSVMILAAMSTFAFTFARSRMTHPLLSNM